MKNFILFAFLAVAVSKTDFYSALSSENKMKIQHVLDNLQNPANSEQRAYKGALLMKSAENQKTPKEKLAVFKEGRILLEREIETNSKNTEYRFLRLIIQENAPKILKYTSNISEDAAWVKKNHSTCPAEVKSAIISYSKKSEILKL